MADQYTFHDITFTWLKGVTFNSDGGTIFGPVPRTLWGQYYPYNELNQIPSRSDPILVEYQGKNYLIDTSLGLDKMSDKAQRNQGVQEPGDIEGSLNALNLTHEAIDGIMMTHMHNDHAGGLTYLENGALKSAFPNAVIYVSEIEWEEVRNPNDRTQGTYLEENWAPVQDQIKTFKHSVEVAPGIKMEHTGGHSRGHSIIRFEQKGDTVLHMADLLMNFVQTNPLWVGAVDDYPMDSIKAKKRLMKEALENNYRFIFYHDPFYRVVEYTEDGKNIQYALKNSHASWIPMTAQQNRTHQVVGELEE
jgi:glyoxylase-like metal-dependent hydrolase (beta-lactamase superfamily II)